MLFQDVALAHLISHVIGSWDRFSSIELQYKLSPKWLFEKLHKERSKVRKMSLLEIQAWTAEGCCHTPKKRKEKGKEELESYNYMKTVGGAC